MQRIITTPRAGWQAKCEQVGFHFHTTDTPYWDESVYYQFTSEQIDELELATQTLYSMCLEVVEYVIKHNRFAEFGISKTVARACIESWAKSEPSIYGRFDFMYDGTGVPKLLEYNADTPTSLLEASIVQWFWLQDTRPECDQFNSIHEALQGVFRNLRPSVLHFSCVKDSPEDLGTVEYLRDVATQCGHSTEHIYIEDLGTQDGNKYLVDMSNSNIHNLFKLYPWEWLVEEGILSLASKTAFIEPIWKMILSNKALLVLLYELFPDSPYLLPASFSPIAEPYVKKPLLSREGSNITIVDGLLSYETTGAYGKEGHIYQQLASVANFGGNYPVIGSWVIGGESVGIGIREDVTRVTGNLSRFVPHLFI